MTYARLGRALLFVLRSSVVAAARVLHHPQIDVESQLCDTVTCIAQASARNCSCRPACLHLPFLQCILRALGWRQDDR